MKKLFLLITAMLLMTCSGTGYCFADTCSVPIHINVAETAVSFSVTEKVNMTAAAGSPDLTVDSLEIVNTGTMGQLCLDDLRITAENGWSLVDKDTDFINMQANAKKFSLTAGTVDFSDTDSQYPAETAKVGERITVTFTGKTGASTEIVQDVQIARIVATVSLL